MVEPLPKVQRKPCAGTCLEAVHVVRDVGVASLRTRTLHAVSSARARRHEDRTFSATELSALAEALGRWEDQHPAQVAAIRLAAVTGLRIGEILAIRWEHLDLDTGRLTLPATKTGRRQHDLPAAALAILIDPAPNQRMGPSRPVETRR